jgi:hypothetical protein
MLKKCFTVSASGTVVNKITQKSRESLRRKMKEITQDNPVSRMLSKHLKNGDFSK